MSNLQEYFKLHPNLSSTEHKAVTDYENWKDVRTRQKFPCNLCKYVRFTSNRNLMVHLAKYHTQEQIVTKEAWLSEKDRKKYKIKHGKSI